MILVQYILTELGLNLEFSENVIEADYGNFKGSTTPMVDLGTYLFKYLNTGEITPEEVLQMLMLEKYMSQNIYVLPLNNYV